MGIKYLLYFLSLAALLNYSNGCQIDGVTNWLFIVDAEMYDYYEGTFWSRTATNIAAITNFSTGGGVNSESYISAALQNGNVTLTTTTNYPQYEETETSDTMSFTLTFRCTDGSTNLLTFEIKVIDTNNNDPIFLPDDTYEFTVLPPLPPGFEITGCGQDIVVRDIDLTTSSIVFSIEENPYLEVVSEGRSPSDYKQFLASLRTIDLIRSLPEDVELTISATDVDQTGDPPRTTYATINLKADEEFQFPEEPVFSQPFYLVTYVDDQLVTQQAISLQQGFDGEVVFSIDEDQLSDPNLSNYIGLTINGNEVLINATSLPDEIVRSGQVILVVRADRQYTSGDTTTVILQFPEVPALEFEESLYSGRIVDNVLQPVQITLKQGYEEGFSVSIHGEYASFFSFTTQGPSVILSMAALDTVVLNENNFLTLQVIASNAYSSTTAIVSLDIVKDDTVTPLFEKPIYLGEYAAEAGLTVEPITLIQGYDDNVSFFLQGGTSKRDYIVNIDEALTSYNCDRSSLTDHAEFFQLTQDGATAHVTSSSIPVEIWTKQHILLTVGATKPRTVTSTATLSISLPLARELSFDALVYSGTLYDLVVDLPSIPLSVGYDDDVTFVLDGEYSSYFTLSTTQNQVSLHLPTALPDDVVTQNNFLTLTLRASGTHSLPASATLVLEILKQDLQTPVFTEKVYKGTFDNDHLELETIRLSQGYDSSVTYRLQGEHSQYFRLDNVENNVTLELQSEIPADVIFSEKLLVFTVLADKPLTVGGNAAISIAFPEELTDATVMEFSRSAYVGYLENTELNLETIVLQTGYEDSTYFTLSGTHAAYFIMNFAENVITISVTSALTEEIIANNNFIVLELKAERERAVPATASVVIDIIKEEVVTPVFSKAYYVTVFSNNTFEEKVISLSKGHDDTVSYTLEGENSNWFEAIQSGENVVLSLNSSNGPVPDEILESNNFFLFSVVAHKPGAISAKAAVFVDIPKAIPKPVILRFSQNSYVGRIENDELYAPTLTLLGNQEPIHFNIAGDYAQYFEVTQITPTEVQILLSNGFPENIEELLFIILDIEAQYPEAITGHTSIVLEIIKQPHVITPVFEQAYYTGEISQQELEFSQSIWLIQGFDDSVVFTLAGDDAQFFDLIQNENNSLILAVNNELEQIRDRSHLTFSVVANKAGSVPGMAAIVISLPELSTAIPLRFAQNIYRSSNENGSFSIYNIVLEEGYSADISVDFTGDYMAYFQLTNQEGTFSLQQSSNLPDEILETNNVLVFNIEVQLEDSRTHTTVILEIIKSKVSLLAFEEAYYVGSYSTSSGFTFDHQITLMGGNDETVSFSLEGEYSEWFSIVQDQYPITLVQSNPIPNDIVSNNQQLIFVIVGGAARSTIIVTIDSEKIYDFMLSFAQLTYLGSIENDSISLQPITLSEGYTDDVSFILQGELASYFDLSSIEAITTISLQESIPEDLIPDNGLIILELQASAPQALPATTTIILQVKQEQTPTSQQLIFDATYYTGQYTESEGLTFEEVIKLIEGYDENVQFTLEGDNSQYFEAVITDNSVTLRLRTAIPPTMVSTNHHFIFTIRAEGTYAVTSRATIIIALRDDRSEDMVVLGFSRVSYSGSIENNTVSTDTIILSEGYSELVTFTLIGDFADYFIITPSQSAIDISLSVPIPEENRIIILELQAVALEAIPAYTTVILEVIPQDADEMVFSSLYYTGEYSKENGLNMSETMGLALGYDDTVVFSLQGEQSQWFQIETSSNAVTLSMTESIPDDVLGNFKKLVFFIFAERFGRSANAVIIISLNKDESTSDASFERVLYQGSVEDGVVTHESITINEYDGSNIELVGDDSGLFSANITDGVVTVQGQGSVNLPATTTYLALELRAGAASAVLLLNIIQNEIPEVTFNKSLFQGIVEDGVVTHEVISLTGYEGSIILGGEFAELFTAINTNIEVVVQSTEAATIPATLTFVALELGAGSANAVLLLDVIHGEIPEVTFNKTLYQGRVEDSVVTHETITVTGYSGSTVQLEGEYSELFTATVSDEIVTIQLTGSMTLPATLTFVALELSAGSANAVLLLEVIDSGYIPEVYFDKILYQGRVEDFVVTHETITLTGYSGSTIQLDGEHSALFTAEASDGVVTIQSRGSLTLPGDLTFVALELTAETANAILVLDVIHSGEPPTFDKTLYEGRVENSVVSHETISLTGYSGPTIQVIGDYSELFTATISDGIVTVVNTESLTLPASLTFIALELRAGTAYAILILDVMHLGEPPAESFDKTLYQGIIENDVVAHETITLTGYSGTVIQLDGEYSALFSAEVSDGVVTVQSSGSLTLPADLTFVALELTAGTANAILVLDVIHSGEPPTFDKTTYEGRVEDGVVSHETISLTGYSGSTIQVIGDYSELFTATVSGGIVTVLNTESLTLPASPTFLALELRAGSANAILILDIIHSGDPPPVTFDKTFYQGRVEDDIVIHETITLTGYSGSTVESEGEYSALFTATVSDGVVTVQASGSLELPTNLTFVALGLRAGTANAILILDVIQPGEPPTATFDKTSYEGRIEDGVVTHETITLTGFSGSNIQLDGEFSEFFTATVTNDIVTVQAAESLILPSSLTFVALGLRAGTANAILVSEVIHSGELPTVAFDKTLYQGRVEDGVVTHETITLTDYSGSNVQLDGEYSALFTATVSDGIVTVQHSESLILPASLTFVALELTAGTAHAILILDVIHSGEAASVKFDNILYEGRVEDDVVTHETITLTEYSGLTVQLEGEYSALFTATVSDGIVTVQTVGPLTLPASVTFVALELRAGTANAILILDVTNSGEPPTATFDKNVYQGRVDDGIVIHETITLTGYSESTIQLGGEYSALFAATVNNSVVIVQTTGSVTLPTTLTFLALELEAAGATSVLLLEVTHEVAPSPPTITFSSPSYILRVDVTHTGIVGRVEASADNGEDVTYSLIVEDAHLLQRISVSNNGELFLSASANSGVYSIQVVATTVFSDASGTAMVHLTVETITSCGNDYVLPPLQILERDEESPHSLITLNPEDFPGCRYTLSNRWPNDQQWLYVDETGLHTRSIDREHASIAFMALSQVQVELTLECDSDSNNVRTKRTVETYTRINQLDRLGPYDYGPYKWILTDSILHDSRKSLVNLIVNDINDNYPIFEGVENQPLIVGWPVADLEERILPRYLAEVKATDADIGENAALVYWSNDEVLAVSPATGLVHVRNNAQLEDNSRFTVYATDQNGNGFTGSLELLVKLIDTSHIAVVTVREAFLNDEGDILSNLSLSVGYEIKALRVAVISDTESDETNSRIKRETIISTGASIQLYVYGLIQREPVEVEQLTEDINSIQGNIETVVIVSTVSLEDHLESLAICPLPGRDIGLLVSTIVLAVLLFVLIVVAAVWFFLKWRKEKNYEQFSDANSLASRDDSLKPTPISEHGPKPRINIEDLKRSERRLQEMLDAPVTEVTVDPTASKVSEKNIEAKVNMPEPPLVIQSIDKLKAVDDDSDDEDEFGERKKARRKSVVTFNENVERIIHVEDTPNDDNSDLEVFRL